MKIIKMLVALALTITTSSCSLLPPAEEIALYQLPVSSLAASEQPPANWTLRIKTPKASDALSGKRMMVVEHANQLAAYAGARWVSSVPELWRNHLVSAALADGRISAVSTDRDSLQADRELSGMLQGFQTDYTGDSPVVYIRFDAIVADSSSRKILASHQFVIRQPLKAKGAAAMVDAYGAAADSLAGEILNWMLAEDSK